jgi:hypothetical protein
MEKSEVRAGHFKPSSPRRSSYLDRESLSVRPQGNVVSAASFLREDRFLRERRMAVVAADRVLEKSQDLV